VQPVAPPSDIKPEALSDLFLRVLHAGLAYSAPGNRYVRERADGHRHSVYGSEIPSPLRQSLAPPAEDATAAEALNGSAPTAPPVTQRKRGRLYSAAADTLGIAEQFMDPNEEEDPLFDENGNPHVLDANDPLAVEFREQLRTW
jgi:hypothetical protein